MSSPKVDVALAAVGRDSLSAPLIDLRVVLIRPSRLANDG